MTPQWCGTVLDTVHWLSLLNSGLHCLFTVISLPSSAAAAGDRIPVSAVFLVRGEHAHFIGEVYSNVLLPWCTPSNVVTNTTSVKYRSAHGAPEWRPPRAIMLLLASPVLLHDSYKT